MATDYVAWVTDPTSPGYAACFPVGVETDISIPLLPLILLLLSIHHHYCSTYFYIVIYIYITEDI